MLAPRVSPAPASDDYNTSRCRCSSSSTTPATRLRRQRKPRCVKPHNSFATLAAVSAVALMASGVTAAATSPHDGASSAAVAASALHLPVLTHDAGRDASSQQLQVDTDTITPFSREVGLVKRDPRPGDSDDPSGSWEQQIYRRDSDSNSDSPSSSS